MVKITGYSSRGPTQGGSALTPPPELLVHAPGTHDTQTYMGVKHSLTHIHKLTIEN